VGIASAYEDEISKTLSRLESSIEGSEVPPPIPPVEPSPEDPIKPGGFKDRRSPLAAEERSAFFPGLSSHVSYKAPFSRTGSSRGGSDENYCWPEHEYRQKDECEERGCMYFDQEWRDCKYVQALMSAKAGEQCLATEEIRDYEPSRMH
jgi:hypothetical protein